MQEFSPHAIKGELRERTKWPMSWRARLADLIKSDGRTRAEIQRAADVNSTALRDILDREQTPSVDQLSRIAKALNTTLSALYDGEHSVSLTLNINGVTSGDNGVWAEISRQKTRVIPLDLLDKEHVCIEVRGDDLHPEYRQGDIITGPKVKGPHLDNYIGFECIVQATDGAHFIGVLQRGSGLGKFNVRPFNLRRPEIRDVKIAWAAPIQMILRGTPN